MSTLNISVPEQLKNWVIDQVDSGKYASVSDYLRDLIREDIGHQQQEINWFSKHLNAVAVTPDEEFIKVSAQSVKARARQKVRDRS